MTGFSNSGCITYVETDSSVLHNIEALETLVNYAMDKDIPYFAINVPNDVCNNCGYCGDVVEKCPQCGSSDVQRLRRVTGYLTSDYKKAFNAGKQQEVEQRVKHTGVLVDWIICLLKSALWIMVLVLGACYGVAVAHIDAKTVTTSFLGTELMEKDLQKMNCH